MTGEELDLILSYPLDIKIAKTKARLREWVKYFGEDNVYISYSGGKDSTVLLHIAREEFPDIKAAYCDTGLEYPEIKTFVKQQDNVDIIRPRKNFKEVITDYGYPIVSKEQAHFIYEIRNSKSEKLVNRRLYGTKKGGFKLAEKWKYLIDAPFRISHLCCYHMKKSPFKSYQTKTGRFPILATRVTESRLRKTEYLLNGGCNSFFTKNPKSQPLSFWTEQDVLTYLKQHDLKLPTVYGEIVNEDNQISFFEGCKKLCCSGVNRTGCIFCAFGCQYEQEPNRYQQLKQSHPALYDYCINGGEFDDKGLWIPSNDGLGFGFVLDYLGVKY